MTRLSIIIPVFNTLEYTKKCLGYLRNSLALIDKNNVSSIIVIDDGSTDGSSDWIISNYPEVTICKGDGNLWWSGGVNVGIQHARSVLKCDYILLWNNDIRPAENYFELLFTILSTNPYDSIIGSGIFFENKIDKLIFSLGGNFNPKTGKHSLIGYGKPAQHFTQPDIAPNWFPGMGTTIHTTVFDKIGYFDTVNFPQYKGDADFSLRAFKAGYKLNLHPELEIWNDRENTGYSNNKSLTLFIRSLVSTKSNANIYRDLLFYRRHATSFSAYGELLRKYFKHIGGFIKWKFLNLLGFQRKNR